MGNGLRYPKKTTNHLLAEADPLLAPPLRGLSATREFATKTEVAPMKKVKATQKKWGGDFRACPFLPLVIKGNSPHWKHSKWFLFWKNGRFWMNVSFGKRESTTLTFYTWSPFSPQNMSGNPPVRSPTIVSSRPLRNIHNWHWYTLLLWVGFSCARWLTCLSSPRHWDVQLFPSFAEHFLKKRQSLTSKLEQNTWKLSIHKIL